MNEPVKQLSVSLRDIKLLNNRAQYKLLVDGADLRDIDKIELIIEAMESAVMGIKLDLAEAREEAEDGYE